MNFSVADEQLRVYRLFASPPFAQPATGKIAVKVINNYGDEVVKVVPV